MPAATLNYSIEQGSDFEITFQYNDSNNNPINLVNKCVVLQMKPVDGDGGCLTFSSAANASLNVNGWSLAGNADGQIVFKLLGSETNQLDFTKSSYDLDVIDYSQNNTLVSSSRLATGNIFIIGRATAYLKSCPNSTTYRGACGGGGGNTVTRTTYNDLIFSDANFSASQFNNTDFSNVIFNNCVFSNADFSTSTTSDAVFAQVDSGSDVGTDGDTITDTDTGVNQSDLCIDQCLSLDLYSVVYTGSGITILDESTVSGTISVDETIRTIDSIDIAIGGLSHTNPQDLIFSLVPPSGSGILLSSNHKIPNYVDNFNYIFSNKAAPTKYLHNINNGEYCRIYDKSNPDYLSSFDHMVGHVGSGDWSLYIQDTDPIASGSIDSWKVIITYEA